MIYFRLCLKFSIIKRAQWKGKEKIISIELFTSRTKTRATGVMVTRPSVNVLVLNKEKVSDGIALKESEGEGSRREY